MNSKTFFGDFAQKSFFFFLVVYNLKLENILQYAVNIVLK